MVANIGIKSENLSTVAKSLSQILADEFVLYTKTRNAHWNVEGPDFAAMHKFFEHQYETLDETMDEVAERLRMLGHYAPGTLQDFLKLTRLTEESRKKNDSKGFISELLEDHESIITLLRGLITPLAEEQKDFGTSDFITGLMQTHEKMAWMLRAHLK